MRLSSQAIRVVILSTAALASAIGAAEQTEPFVHVPESTALRASFTGPNAPCHTNHLIWTGPAQYHDEYPLLAEESSHGPALFHLFTGPSGYHPSDLRSAYGDTSNGGGAIAIVDAYHYPSSLNDFNVFANQYGLPNEPSTNALSSSNAVFQVAYASGSQPTTNTSWAQEAALDIEWAHAMAPGAKIYLVEAASSGLGSLLSAASYAASLPGVRQVSMSWGGSEFSYEYLYDGYLSHSGVTFFASSGDSGAVTEYPGESANAVQVGGTTLRMSGGAYLSESTWTSGGGGLSAYEALPSFQSGMGLTKRGGPDIAADADPSTGVSVYDSTANGNYVGWMVFGGTSVASPVCAGLANAGGANRGSGELSWIYKNGGLFHDVTTLGTGKYTVNGVTYYKNPAKVGFDLATGWGSPKSAGSF